MPAGGRPLFGCPPPKPETSSGGSAGVPGGRPPHPQHGHPPPSRGPKYPPPLPCASTSFVTCNSPKHLGACAQGGACARGRKFYVMQFENSYLKASSTSRPGDLATVLFASPLPKRPTRRVQRPPHPTGRPPPSLCRTQGRRPRRSPLLQPKKIATATTKLILHNHFPR